MSEKMETEIFNISTLDGLTRAEEFKERLSNEYNHVKTDFIGINEVRIRGYN